VAHVAEDLAVTHPGYLGWKRIGGSSRRRATSLLEATAVGVDRAKVVFLAVDQRSRIDPLLCRRGAFVTADDR
jgi:hypothetical protein